MFSLNIVDDNDVVMFTLVRPDTTYVSGSRDTLEEVFDVVLREVIKHRIASINHDIRDTKIADYEETLIGISGRRGNECTSPRHEAEEALVRHFSKR